MLKNSKGLTLIEMLVALSLSSLVIMLAVQMYITNASTFSVAQEKSKLTSQAQIVQESISKQAMQSEGVESVWIAGTEYLDKTFDATDSIESITFKLASGDITFKYENNTVKIGDHPLSSDVSRFTILPIPQGTTYKEAKGIKVILELTTSHTRRPIKHEVSTVITFRNK